MKQQKTNYRNLFLILILFGLTITSCNQDNSINSTNSGLNQQLKAPHRIHNSETVDILASDIKNETSLIQRKIELIDRTNNKIFDSFIITMSCDNVKANIYEQLKSKTFTGKFTISNNGIIKEECHVKKGITDINFTDFKSFNITSKVSSCTIGKVHDCVSYKIKEMNVIEYGLCLITGPECYVSIWAICGWDVCQKDMNYINPY
jgi:hypothetical protein